MSHKSVHSKTWHLESPSLSPHTRPMNLADLRQKNPELLLCQWAEGYEFFTKEYSDGHTEPSLECRSWIARRNSERSLPQAIIVVMRMIEAIQGNTESELLGGRYFRTSSAISAHAIIVVRCNRERKIEIESWARDNKHPLLAEPHFIKEA